MTSLFHSKRTTTYWMLLVGLCIIGFAFILGPIVTLFNPEAPNSADRPLLHPKATNIVVLDQSMFQQTVQYDVPAPPQDILAYYDDALRKDGWKESRINRSSRTILYTWGEAPTVCTVSVEVLSSEQSRVQVKLQIHIMK